MTHEELIDSGNDSVRDALDGAIIIINSDGNALSKETGTDSLVFSPKLDCTDSLSTVLFDDEDSAKRTIEELLVPQDSDESYLAISISKFNPDGDTIVKVDSSGDLGDEVEDVLAKVIGGEASSEGDVEDSNDDEDKKNGDSEDDKG